MKKLLVALTMFAGALSAFAELRISEICPRPNAMDPNGRQSGWIELYNDGSEPVDLADYEIVRANRGKALMPAGQPLASRTLAAKAYTVVYTSDEYDNVDSGEVKTYANDVMVYPKKVSPKKFPLVALYKGSELIDRFVVPVDLPDNQSIALAGGPFAAYNGNLGGTSSSSKFNIVNKTKVTRVILPVITKGAANNRTRETAYGPNVGPQYGLAHNFSDISPTPPAKPGNPYTVTLAVNPAADAVDAADAEITSVKLITRTWSIPSSGEDRDRQKTPSLTTGEYVMTKGSSVSGQGQLWTATIPAADLPAAGQLIQWATIITEASGNSYRSPSYRNVKDGYQWYGTIVEPTSAQVSQTLQTWHIFGDANAVTYMDFGNEDFARFGIYDSQTSTYYDNVYLSGRGNSSKNYSKKSHSIKFSKVHPMRCTNPITGEDVESRKTSLLAEYCDMSRVRSSLSMMVRREAGQDVPFGYPIRTQLNGLFYQLAHHSNRFTDELLTDYYGYDKYGVAFKNVGNAAGESSGGSGNNGQQILPEDGTDQLPCYTTFKAGIKGAGNYTYSATGLSESDSNDVNKAVVKMFDLPHWLNYLALARLTQECDDGWSNLCLYYDRNGNGAWRPLAYDLHQSFGVYYYADAYGGKREIWADDDTMKCHPFYGGCHVVSKKKSGAPSYGNRAYEAVYQNAKYRRLHNRRLRTLMDTILMPPGTSREKTPFWRKYVQPMVDAQKEDDLLDRERWGAPAPTDAKSMIYCWDKTLTFAEGVEDLWDNYIVKRRNHFYNTHSITNTSFEGGYAWNRNAQIPLAQSPISALKAKFSATPVAGGIAIRNLNEETVDMSGWRLSGALNFTFPAGTVIDQAFGTQPGEIIVVTDRVGYIDGLEQSGTALTDQVILGNAKNGTQNGCGLWTASGAEVIAGPAPAESQPDEPAREKTVYSGVYNEPIVFSADESCIFSNATLNAGLVVADGVTAKLKAAPDTVNTISSISAPNGEVRLTGEGTVKLEGADTLATVRNLIVKSGTLQVKSTGVAVTKTPVINVLGFVEQTGGVIDLNLDVATTNQIYGIYLANKNEKNAAGDDTVYALFDGGSFNAVVGATKSAAIYVNKGSVGTTFKGGETITALLKGTEPRFLNTAGEVAFKRVEAQVSMPADCGQVTGARVFKSDKKIVISDPEAHFDVDVQGPDAEIFSAANRITIDAGVFELVASDDCFSATTNITVNGGLIYAVSTENDVFDSNGDMELNGGTILAYATADGHEAFDVDPELTEAGGRVHQLRINGGTIFATGGKDAAWPADLVTADGVVLHSAANLASSSCSGRYASLASTIGMVTTARLPAFPGATCALLTTCPNMTGEPTFSASAPSAGSRDFHDLYVEMRGETNQSELRFLEVFGSTDQGDAAAGTFGDVGEYIVLTNISAKTVLLAGVTVSIAKNDIKKGAIDDPKCLITLGVGELPAYGSIRLEQADYSDAGWSKITNGNIFLKLTDALGGVVQSGYASFNNTKYPDVDGFGEALVAISFGASLEDTDACWRSSRKDEPVPPQEDDPPQTDPDPGVDGHEGVQLWANGPYWATMNPGATKPTEAGYYYLNNTDTIGYAVEGGALTGRLARNSSETLWGNGWRLPTTAEARLIKEYCVIASSGTDAAGQPYIVVQGNTPGYTDKSVVFPLAGYGNGGSVSTGNRWGTYGKYWTSDTGIAARLCFGATYFEYTNGGDIGHGNYYTIRLVRDAAPSGGSGSTHTHTWGTPTYTWSADNASCTATRSCSGCTQKDTKTVSATYAVVTAATASADGLGRWTATFSSPFATQTKDVTIPKSGSSDPVTPSDPVIPSDGSMGVQLWANGPYWATQNVGASSETDAGKFFMWGATTGYSTGDANIPFGVEANCATSGKSLDQLKSGGFVDSEGNLAKSYDAAYMTMGGTWRMPTYAEWQALTKNCTFAWDDSRKVLVVTGKDAYANAKIYLPCPGYWNRNSSTGAVTLGNQNFCSYYFSSTPVSENGNTAQAYAVTVQKGGAYDGQKMARYNGYCVRAVSTTNPGGGTGEDDPVPHTHTWGAPTYSWSADGKSCTATRACTDTTCGETETETVTATFVTTKEATTEATGLGHYEATFRNSAFAKQSGADITIPKKEQQDDPPQTDPGASDLGVVQLWENGPYWATNNLGAASESGTGDFYMWGATVGYTKAGTSWKGTDGSTSTAIPYGNSIAKGKSLDALKTAGIVDANGTVIKSYDAANVALGGDWRLPTKADVEAMVAYCTVTSKTIDGVKGVEVRGKGAFENNAIFLPQSGYIEASNGNQNNKGGQTYYLTATPVGNTTQYSCLRVDSAAVAAGTAGLNNGYQIRPVRDTVPSTPTETVDWDHPEVTIAAGVTAGTAWSALKNSALDAADAAKLQVWAKNVGKVAFESAGDIKLEAFLLNCANTDAAIDAAKAEFKFTSFDPDNLPKASDFDEKGYNGVVTIEGRAALDTGEWAAAKSGDRFFRAVLSL